MKTCKDEKVSPVIGTRSPLKAIDVAMKIKSARIAQGIKPKQLAEMCEITVEELELIENGDKVPSLDVLCVILRVLGIKV